MKNADRPAYPIVSDLGYPTATVNLTNDTRDELCSGLTKREYFAAIVLQGMTMRADGMADIDFVVKKSIQCADELLKQLEQ